MRLIQILVKEGLPQIINMIKLQALIVAIA